MQNNVWIKLFILAINNSKKLYIIWISTNRGQIMVQQYNRNGMQTYKKNKETYRYSVLLLI